MGLELADRARQPVRQSPAGLAFPVDEAGTVISEGPATRYMAVLTACSPGQ